MADLEYRIGGLKIGLKRLKFTGSDPYKASHKFVVGALDDVVSLYVAEGSSHRAVAGRFNLPEHILVGGGSCYLDSKGRLVLDDLSRDHLAIPEVVAERFAKLMIPKLGKLGVKVKGVAVNPRAQLFNYFWFGRDLYSK